MRNIKKQGILIYIAVFSVFSCLKECEMVEVKPKYIISFQNVPYNKKESKVKGRNCFISQLHYTNINMKRKKKRKFSGDISSENISSENISSGDAFILKSLRDIKRSELFSSENTDWHDKTNAEETKYNLVKKLKKYCEDTKMYKRLPSREVQIGKVKIGGKNRISIQTMTSCDTRNVDECVNQILKCSSLGADMVRLTVQGTQEAEASFRIKDKLLEKNCDIPLIADIHFNPKIALMAVDVFDKIRINPGNFVDGRKKWENKVYQSKEQFDEAKKYIREKLVPLIEKCKRLNRAIRIGTNHGSLSARVFSYYGDTPLGMVESALEFSDICLENNFFNIVYSMKASNAFVMIHSYRLLVNKQYERNMFFPLHLGVTEAGFGDNGRIKSYLGIGSLLYDGIGDTIRISLTEDPWNELDPCRRLIKILKKRAFYQEECEKEINSDKAIVNKNTFNDTTLDGDTREVISNKSNEQLHEKNKTILQFDETFRDFSNITNNISVPKGTFLHEDGSIGNALTTKEFEDPLQLYNDLNLDISESGDLKKGVKSSDIIILKENEIITTVACRTMEKLMKVNIPVLIKYNESNIRFLEIKAKGENYILYMNAKEMINYLGSGKDEKIHLEKIKNRIKGYCLVLNGEEGEEYIKKIKQLNPTPLFILLRSENIYKHILITRRINELFHRFNIKIPYIHYVNILSHTYEDILAEASLYAGTCLIDLMGNGLIIDIEEEKVPEMNKGNTENGTKESTEKVHKIKKEKMSRVAFNSFLVQNILQDARIRLFKTDYIACPSCGRTLFNIQETTQKIMKLTGHLKGVKIAVMGCIVNGIGEMADAHFGYVGSAPKKIDLYLGKQLVERNVPEEEACDRLVQLIKKNNRWVDPPK